MNRAEEIERLYEVFKEQYESEPKLKLFFVIFSRPGQRNIEMTILHKNQLNAEWAVTHILEQEGYDTRDMKLTVREIEGPFEMGTILSRNGG